MSATLEAAAGAAEITGYVEAATETTVLGWAWSPRRPELRVTVALMLGNETILSMLADLPRDDLARNGVGDGRHAFSLAVPQALRPRAAELKVVGRLADGEPVPLGPTPPSETVSARLDRLQRGLDLVVGSQRVLHRNLQAALLKADGADTAGDASRLLETIGSQVAALEIFVMRLDERLAALAPPPSPPPNAAPARRVGLRPLVAAALLVVLAAAAAGLWRSLSA